MDDIERAFLEISPEDFFRDTSATTRLEHPVHMLDANMTTGVDNFNHFVNAMLLGTRRKTVAGRGFNPFSVLHNTTEQRYFRPDDDETPIMYAQRLTREAEAMHATWFFNAMLSPGRAFDGDADDQPPIDTSSVESVLEALERGVLQLGICWTAACATDTEVTRRGGIIYLNPDDTPGQEIEGTVTPSTDPFHQVLGL